jgi:hypothetical protein
VLSHIFTEPTIGTGELFTSTTTVALHPRPSEYVMIAEPEDNPATTPDNEPTDATTALLLVHVPLGVTSLSSVVVPAQIVVVPEIAAGVGLTVSTAVMEQPPAAT